MSTQAGQYVEFTVPRMQRRKWTEREDQILVTNQFARIEVLIRELRRTDHAINARRKMLRAQGRIQ